MRARSVAAAALAGLLIALGGAPLELSFLSLMAPGALLLAIEPGGHTHSLPFAAGLGLVTGVVTHVISMGWIIGLLATFAGLPTALAALVGSLLWLAQSLPYALATSLTVALVRAGAAGWCVLPAALTVSASVVPAIFPWRYGISQLPFLEFAQVAELGGLPLLDWLAAVVGCGGAEAIRRRDRAAAIAAAVALVAPPIYGAIRLPQIRAERAAATSLRVGVAQPNVSIADKHEPRRFLAQLDLPQTQTRTLEAEGAELVLWPETAYRFPVLRGSTRDRRGRLSIRGEGIRGPLLVGTLTTDGPRRRYRVTGPEGETVDTFVMAEGRRFNSVIAVNPQGRIVGTADKVHPLAFGESTPLWEQLPFLQWLPRGISPGTGAQVLEVAGARVGVLNCYEDLLAEHVRAQMRAAPDFWANATNDAWFGDTNAPHLHHMNARLRAIETRRDMVRAVNTGVSGHTAATGEDLVRTAPFTRDRFVADLRLLGGSTPYARLGDWPSAALMGALLGFVLARRRFSCLRGGRRGA